MWSDAVKEPDRITRYLTPLAAWALSFGCAVGWGAFVMPGTMFLPKAGPLGTLAGIATGALIMIVIGFNYSFLINKYPDNGGTLTYAAKTFGYDHGFISSWFLILVYIAIIWANATALPLIARYLLGDMFKFGFSYKVFDYDVYLGEVLLSMSVILIVGSVCSASKKAAVVIQTVCVVVLLAGILICFTAILVNSEVGCIDEIMSFAGTEKAVPVQVWDIILLAPWAFVGFESISNSAGEMKLKTKNIKPLLIISVITGAVAYILLALIPSMIYPSEFSSLQEYLGALDTLDGIKGLPVFYSVEMALDKAGIVILGLAALSAILTGLIGHYVAASRLIFSMSDDGILPKWFGKLDKKGTPRNAILFIAVLSFFIPFLGRSAIGWIIDVNTLGASVAYLYTSAAAFVIAKKENDKRAGFFGMTGIVISVIFILSFLFFSSSTIQTETYLILAVWAILGFAFFYYVFNNDAEHRFGKSTIVWIGLMSFVFLISLAWVKQSNSDQTKKAIHNVEEYYQEERQDLSPEVFGAVESFSEQQITESSRIHTRNSIIQLGINFVSLIFMFSIYRAISKREHNLELQKIRAEESNRAKTHFLFNMSHDIRTPMNAILGFTHILMNDNRTSDSSIPYIEKINTAGKQLLGIINDVLDMSRIESGKIELRNEEHDLAEAVKETFDLFCEQMEGKDIKYKLDIAVIPNTCAVFDKTHFMRIMMNLISNACKFTPQGGNVYVFISQSPIDENDTSDYVIRVKDSGEGIDPEFASKMFEPFERAKTSTESGISGTGLGLAIVKSIVDAMNGTITVESSPDKGSEFIVKVNFPVVRLENRDESATNHDDAKDDFFGKRILLVEDMEINREIAVMLLEDMGFVVDTAVNGKEALVKYESSKPGYYDAVITDIQMPVMDGYELTSAIRSLKDKAYSDIPVIAMTANAMKEDEEKTMNMGMNGHIPKPLDVNVMSEIIRSALNRR